MSIKGLELFLSGLLTKARLSKNMTQTEVARRLGKPQSFVSKYESGERRLDVIEFVAICKALGADPGKIIKEIEVQDG
ncbi:MAG: helix-turn-helix transcriptional regulator [Chloroflexi bacterium]|nr:helix-turn-helix transcriptional regulator [Chloroflexota bacterium]